MKVIILIIVLLAINLYAVEMPDLDYSINVPGDWTLSFYTIVMDSDFVIISQLSNDWSFSIFVREGDREGFPTPLLEAVYTGSYFNGKDYNNSNYATYVNYLTEETNLNNEKGLRYAYKERTLGEDDTWVRDCFYLANERYCYWIDIYDAEYNYGSIYYDTTTADYQEALGILRTFEIIEQPVMGKIRPLLKPAGEIEAYPNPFKDLISIRNKTMEIQKALVYNIRGKRVKTIKAKSSSGIKWDGTDDQGNGVAPGAYIVDIRNKTQRLQKEILLIK